MPEISNDEQVVPCREPDPSNGAQLGDNRRRAWYIDGGIARNCDVQLCCPGVTLNVSPVLQWRVTAMDCIFPMSQDRFAEIQQVSRQDVLQFTDEDQFDLSPAVGDDGGAEVLQQRAGEGGHKPPSRTPSVASLSLSRNNSTSDLHHHEKAKPAGGMAVSNSQTKLGEFAAAVASKLQPRRSRSVVWASSTGQRQLLVLFHSRALGFGRYWLALVLWTNRLLEYVWYRHGFKVTLTFALAAVLRRLAMPLKAQRRLR